MEAAQPCAVGVDLGGTKIASGVVSADGAVLRRARRDSPSDSAAAVADAIVASVRDLGTEAEGLPVGIGAAGLLDRAGRMRYAPNLPLRDFPLRDEVVDRLSRPVLVENDANAAAWAEYRIGAASAAADSAVMLTIGTGVGGGFVTGGTLSRGANGLGGEFGHLIVAEGSRGCACGNRGCLEAMASGTALGRTAAEWREAGKIPSGSALADTGAITGVDVGQAARAGDATAAAVVAECGHWLGVGVASLVNALDPEVVVIGGGASALGGLLLEPARASASGRVIGQPQRAVPPIVAAELGADAGLIGAAFLALARPN